MSAYLCSDNQFKALAIFASSRDGYGCMKCNPSYVRGIGTQVDTDTNSIASIYADILKKENIRSVDHRYQNSVSEFDPVNVTNADRANGKLIVRPIDILKMCGSVEYQSCETEDYEDTVAYRLLNAIRLAAISSLPGYEEAIRDVD